MADFAPTVPRIDGTVFLVEGHDHEDGSSAKIREDFLEQHLHYVEKNCDRYLVCGPLWPPGEEAIRGSFFLIQAVDQAAAQALVDGDPYVDAGVYAKMVVRQVTPAAGRLLGGVIWESAEAVRQYASQPRKTS
ncbi:MAG: YciI family protein [Pseudomonadota bacterium]